MNSFWAILELVKPIKLSQVALLSSVIEVAQVGTLEPFYLLREGAHDKEVRRLSQFLEIS